MRKGQQEMVGFALIVVVVIIALLVFLVISARKPAEQKSIIAKNMLSSILGYTTDCAITFEPQYSTIGDLIKNSFEDEDCSNLNLPASVYLNETLKTILEDIILTESSISSYKFDVFIKNEKKELLVIDKGNCTGRISGWPQEISTGEDVLIATLKLCS